MKETEQIRQLHIPLMIRDVLRNFWLVVLAGIIAAIGVFAYGNLAHTLQYTSECTFAVSPKSSGSYVGFYSSLNTANEMAAVFKEVFTSDVLKRMIREDLNDSSIGISISAEVQEGTNILCVTATSDAPEKAHMVMQSVLKNYGKVSGYLFGGVVLDAIRSPHVPTGPSNSLNMGLWIAVGAFVAMCLMVAGIAVLSYQRTTIKTLDAARAYMQDAPMGVLIREKQRGLGKNTIKGLLITRATVSFPYVETMLQIAHKIRHKMRKNQHKILLITSVAENEGKSTVAANLALAMAKHGSRVALVDMDMRRPAIHKLFSETMKGYDLMDCIQNKVPKNLKNKNLSLFTIPAPCKNVSQLLHDPAVENFLQQLRQQVDFVILDTPPYMAVADTGILLKFADCSLMILRQDWVPGEVLQSVSRELESSKAEYLGYVLNYYVDDGSDSPKQRYYNRYDRYAGYSREEQT